MLLRSFKEATKSRKWQVRFWRIIQKIPYLRRHPLLQTFNRLSRHTSGPNLDKISYCTPDKYSQYLTPAPPLQSFPVPKMTNGIPHMIHCCYGLWDREETIPMAYIENVKTWRNTHPDWDIFLWNKSAIEHLIHHQFPDFWKLFSLAAKPVQQADLARYLILYACGGLYMDLDIECQQSIANLFSDFPQAKLYVSIECELNDIECQATTLYPIRQGLPEHPLRVANYWVAAIPKHPVMWDLLTLVTDRMQLPITSQYDILYTTGGDAMTETIHRNKDSYPDMVILFPRTI